MSKIICSGPLRSSLSMAPFLSSLSFSNMIYLIHGATFISDDLVSPFGHKLEQLRYFEEEYKDLERWNQDQNDFSDYYNVGDDNGKVACKWNNRSKLPKSTLIESWSCTTGITIIINDDVLIFSSDPGIPGVQSMGLSLSFRISMMNMMVLTLSFKSPI